MSQAAEKMAVTVSRRGFLSSLGRLAGAAALGLGGFLTSAKKAQAGKYGYPCYVYKSTTGQLCGRCWGPGTPPPGWQLVLGGYVTSCKQCYDNHWGGSQCPF
jgi:hypothetical protein